MTPAQTASAAPATPTAGPVAAAGSDSTTQRGGAWVVAGAVRGLLVHDLR
jgi:hypothetical protein